MDKLKNHEFEDLEEGQTSEIINKGRRVYSDKPDRSIFELYRQYKKGNLELQPEFQRLQVWDNKKYSRLIESVLLEVPIPVIYLSEDWDNKYLVIDGQQRLKAFINFIENNLRLNGLTILSELNGKKYQQIPESLQNKFESSTIRIIEIRKESHPDVKFEIFERLNTGSVQLNAQELRNCIYRGRYNELLKELTQDKGFQFLLGLDVPHPRMKDRELILRFLSFYHKSFREYVPSMKRFLNNEMEQFRNLNETEEIEIRRIFDKCIRISKIIFGNKAFKRFIIGSGRNPNGHWETKKINKALYDIVVSGFTMFEENQIVSKSDQIREELLWLMTNDVNFIDSITFTTDNKDKIFTRFNKWISAIKEIAGTTKTGPRSFYLQYKKQIWESKRICDVCKQEIHDFDDAEINDFEHYWRGGKSIPLNARLAHRYCNRAKNQFVSSSDIKELKNTSKAKNGITRTRGGIPVKDFYLPILKALETNGGKATQSQVFEIIEREMKNQFNRLDYEKLQDDYTPRWKKHVAWARYYMVNREEFLLSNSPRGLWEISERGRAFLKLKSGM
ncbi:DUF262 domain-containing protein [candidate division KSB1 bacterium]|nr:DUF262 domain-containing protein [candidate division KSB1 bacterium]